MKEREEGGRERERERTLKRREGKEGKYARATETSNLSLKSASAISKRDENIVREKQGRLYIAERKAMFKAEEKRREGPKRNEKRTRERER